MTFATYAGVPVMTSGPKARRSLVSAAAAFVMLLLAGCATADLSVDSAARVSGTISVDVSKDSLTGANVTTVEGFQKVIETRLASTPGSGRLFANAVYTANDSGFNVTTTYSKAAFDDSANTYARVAGSRNVASEPLSIMLDAAGTFNGSVDIPPSSAPCVLLCLSAMSVG